MNGTPYFGNGIIVTIQTGTVYVTYTYPYLLLTMLNPGDSITQVRYFPD